MEDDNNFLFNERPLACIWIDWSAIGLNDPAQIQDFDSPLFHSIAVSLMRLLNHFGAPKTHSSSEPASPYHTIASSSLPVCYNFRYPPLRNTARLPFKSLFLINFLLHASGHISWGNRLGFWIRSHQILNHLVVSSIRWRYWLQFPLRYGYRLLFYPGDHPRATVWRLVSWLECLWTLASIMNIRGLLVNSSFGLIVRLPSHDRQARLGLGHGLYSAHITNRFPSDHIIWRDEY